MSCGGLDTWLTKLQDESSLVIIQNIVCKEKESVRDWDRFVSVGKSTCMFRYLPEESSVSTRGDDGSWDRDSFPKTH
jgi:hypothetical protein